VLRYLIDELEQLWGWFCATQPIRVLVSPSGREMEPERRLLTSRIDALPDIDALAIDKDAREGADDIEVAQWTRTGVARADIVLFLFAAIPGTSSGSRPNFSGNLSESMSEVALAHDLRKRCLAYSLVQPFPDDEALLPYSSGDLDSLKQGRSQAPVIAPGASDVMRSVLLERDRRVFRDAWRGQINTVEALDQRIVADLQQAAVRLRLLRRGRRILAVTASVGLAGWLVVRFGFIGAVLVIASAGAAYLWALDRRWERPELWSHTRG
jgi:hypothetical protein